MRSKDIGIKFEYFRTAIKFTDNTGNGELRKEVS